MIIKFQAKLEKAEAIEDCGESKECDESHVLLRVKDPLAALYPFVGIVAEVRAREIVQLKQTFSGDLLVYIDLVLCTWMGKIWNISANLGNFQFICKNFTPPFY